MIITLWVGLKTLSWQGVSETEFCGNSVCIFSQFLATCRVIFLISLEKSSIRYRLIGYDINVILKCVCSVDNPVMVNENNTLK